jgi:cold shock CspA family protein
MKSLRIGEVLIFREDKKYGFLQYSGQRDIFFRLQDVTGIVCLAGMPKLAPYQVGRFINRQPVVGDRILFNLVTTKKGPRAILWSYADNYDRILNMLLPKAG